MGPKSAAISGNSKPSKAQWKSAANAQRKQRQQQNQQQQQQASPATSVTSVSSKTKNNSNTATSPLAESRYSQPELHNLRDVDMNVPLTASDLLHSDDDNDDDDRDHSHGDGQCDHDHSRNRDHNGTSAAQKDAVSSAKKNKGPDPKSNFTSLALLPIILTFASFFFMAFYLCIPNASEWSPSFTSSEVSYANPFHWKVPYYLSTSTASRPALFSLGYVSQLVSFTSSISDNLAREGFFETSFYIPPVDEKAAEARFTGRADLLSSLTTALHSPRTVVPLVILTGAPGVGKSAVIAEHIRRSPRPSPPQLSQSYVDASANASTAMGYEAVFWFQASSPAVLLHEYSAACAYLGLKAEDQSLPALAERLNAFLIDRNSWLIVYDDVQGAEMVDFIRHFSHLPNHEPDHEHGHEYEKDRGHTAPLYPRLRSPIDALPPQGRVITNKEPWKNNGAVVMILRTGDDAVEDEKESIQTLEKTLLQTREGTRLDVKSLSLDESISASFQTSDVDATNWSIIAATLDYNPQAMKLAHKMLQVGMAKEPKTVGSYSPFSSSQALLSALQVDDSSISSIYAKTRWTKFLPSVVNNTSATLAEIKLNPGFARLLALTTDALISSHSSAISILPFLASGPSSISSLVLRAWSHVLNTESLVFSNIENNNTGQERDSMMESDAAKLLRYWYSNSGLVMGPFHSPLPSSGDPQMVSFVSDSFRRFLTFTFSNLQFSSSSILSSSSVPFHVIAASSTFTAFSKQLFISQSQDTDLLVPYTSPDSPQGQGQSQGQEDLSQQYNRSAVTSPRLRTQFHRLLTSLKASVSGGDVMLLSGTSLSIADMLSPAPEVGWLRVFTNLAPALTASADVITSHQRFFSHFYFLHSRVETNAIGALGLANFASYSALVATDATRSARYSELLVQRYSLDFDASTNSVYSPIEHAHAAAVRIYAAGLLGDSDVADATTEAALVAISPSARVATGIVTAPLTALQRHLSAMVLTAAAFARCPVNTRFGSEELMFGPGGSEEARKVRAALAKAPRYTRPISTLLSSSQITALTKSTAIAFPTAASLCHSPTEARFLAASAVKLVYRHAQVGPKSPSVELAVKLTSGLRSVTQRVTHATLAAAGTATGLAPEDRFTQIAVTASTTLASVALTGGHFTIQEVSMALQLVGTSVLAMHGENSVPSAMLYAQVGAIWPFRLSGAASYSQFSSINGVNLSSFQGGVGGSATQHQPNHARIEEEIRTLQRGYTKLKDVLAPSDVRLGVVEAALGRAYELTSKASKGVALLEESVARDGDFGDVSSSATQKLAELSVMMKKLSSPEKQLQHSHRVYRSLVLLEGYNSPLSRQWSGQCLDIYKRIQAEKQLRKQQDSTALNSKDTTSNPTSKKIKKNRQDL